MNKPYALLPEWVICVDSENRVLENHAVIVDDTQIGAIVPWLDARQRYPQINTVELPLSLIHISEPTRRYAISYAVFCL